MLFIVRFVICNDIKMLLTVPSPFQGEGWGEIL